MFPLYTAGLQLNENHTDEV